MKSSMNDVERFKAVALGQKPDYVPIFGFQGAPGMSWGCLKNTHDHLIATGMPRHVGGCYDNWVCHDNEGWFRYWGTTGPIGIDFSMARNAEGFRTTTRREGEFEIIESESGAITRQVIDNANTYSMPEFVRYPVRDRASWEFYKERTAPRQCMSREEMEQHCLPFDRRERPLVISAGGTFGHVRSLMGVEPASLALYDDPELIHEIIATYREHNRRHVFPLIERLRPEVVACWEDIGYKTGMLISPEKFREFCAPLYREIAECARACGVPVRTVDSDGCAMELVPLLVKCGFNSMYPFEAKGNNDLFALRERFPELVMFGWLEKEVVNEGNESLIEQEIRGKVPPLLAKGRYFPNGDHGIQPMVTFKGLCKFMTLLHEACGNPEGKFPRMKPAVKNLSRVGKRQDAASTAKTGLKDKVAALPPNSKKDYPNMKLEYKPDWEETKERYEKWWAHEYFGRCALSVTAPKKNPPVMPAPPPAKTIEQKWYDLDWISAQREHEMSRTFYGGEALPVWHGGYPGHKCIPAFLGCPTSLDWNTGWLDPILLGEDIEFQNLKINKADRNYRFMLDLLRRGVKEARGKCLVSIGAFGGCGDTLASLRGTERLLFDCAERPDQVRAADEFLMDMWCEHYDVLYEIIREADEGSTCWFALWSPGKFYAAQNDFAYNISPQMYRDLFLPVIEKQTRFLTHCVYHVDGVNNFVHVDALLELPRVQAYQIGPGAGKPNALHYIDVLRKVQKAGRNLWISLPIEEVRPALETLSARGLYIATSAESEDEAQELLKNAERWSVDRG